MNPAYSVIIFTTASGAGYGLLIWLSLFGGLGLVAADFWLVLVGFAISFTLIAVGLLSSTFHLGHPERAWRAFSQWKTSWLSREGIAALAVFPPAGLLALYWMFQRDPGGVQYVLSFLTILAAVTTVWCTGMIYASLKTIRQWHLTIVPWKYIILALATGMTLFNFLLLVLGKGQSWLALLAIVALLSGAACKLYYWSVIDRSEKRYSAEAATGLGYLGKVHPLDPPHSQPNFVMREMGYSIARKHALKLRRLVFVSGFIAPAVLTLLTLASNYYIPLIAALLAVLSTAIGILIERWLFFAEAEHVVNVYYGAEAA